MKKFTYFALLLPILGTVLLFPSIVEAKVTESPTEEPVVYHLGETGK